jgi:hypothetical protein
MMAATLDEHIYSQLRKYESQLTTTVRQDAAASNWPSELASKLSIKVTKSGILIEYPDDLATEVEDVEYGTYTSSPAPIMRKFIDKHTTELANAITEWTFDYLFEVGVLP